MPTNKTLKAAKVKAPRPPKEDVKLTGNTAAQLAKLATIVASLSARLDRLEGDADVTLSESDGLKDAASALRATISAAGQG